MTPDLRNYDTVLDACRDWRERQIALKAAHRSGWRPQVTGAMDVERAGSLGPVRHAGAQG